MTSSYRTILKNCCEFATLGDDNRHWYRDARNVLNNISDFRGWAYGRWVDTVSICSPRTSVVRNLRVAYRVMGGHPTPSDVIRSTRAALEHYNLTAVIRGPKTSRFAKVLRGDDDIVVVDTWMARALSVDDLKAGNKSTQEFAERIIGSVAKTFTSSNAEAQAMIWAGIIRTHYKNGSIPGYRAVDVGLYDDVLPDGKLSDTPF